MGDKLVKLQKRAAWEILDADFNVPSELFSINLNGWHFSSELQLKCIKTVCVDAPDYLKHDFVWRLSFI